MGHHQFDITSNSKSPGTGSSIADQVELMDLNGLQRVTQEHKQLLEQTKRRLRDRISSRMGELLLLGHTMLNEYCESCAGILMENRQGVRSCVACDMVNIELSRGQNDSTPVPNNDDPNDVNDIVTGHNNVSRNNEVLQSPAQFSSADSPAGFTYSAAEREGFSVRTLHSRQLPVEIDISSHADFLGSRNVKRAVEAVEDKLNWCAERLKSCEDVEEVMKLYEAIDRGIGILKDFLAK